MSGAFATGVGSSSWADDDDVDLPVTKDERAAPEPIKEEQHELRDDDDRHDEPRSGREHREERGNREEGGYRDDRRGDRRDRGDDRQERGYDRPKNPVPDHAPFKAYVGNVPFRMDENDLADFFGAKDIVDVRIPRDDLDRPKGFAYVEFTDREALVAAIKLDGELVGGRNIRIDAAIERERKPRQRDNFFERRPRRDSPDRQDRDRVAEQAPRERHHLSLLPRSTSTEQEKEKAATPSKKASIFGEAKPRDEAAYQARKQREREERERRAEEKKAAKAQQVKAQQVKAQQAKAKLAEAKLAEAGESTASAPTSARGARTSAGARTREERERAPRSQPAERTQAKREEPHSKQPKREEPQPKQPKQPQTFVKAKAATKVQNVFDLLNEDDSDSDQLSLAF